MGPNHGGQVAIRQDTQGDLLREEKTGGENWTPPLIYIGRRQSCRIMAMTTARAAVRHGGPRLVVSLHDIRESEAKYNHLLSAFALDVLQWFAVASAAVVMDASRRGSLI